MMLYLHGFRSSPAAAKSQALLAAMQTRGLAAQFACPVLSPVPDEAISQAEALLAQALARQESITLIGSSLGGHYATWLAEKHNLRAILINPAVIAKLDLGLFIGRQSNFHTGESFDFTPAHAAQLQAQIPPRLTPARYRLLLSADDEVLDYRHALAYYAGSQQSVLPGDNHSFSRFAEFIPEILACQQHLHGIPG